MGTTTARGGSVFWGGFFWGGILQCGLWRKRPGSAPMTLVAEVVVFFVFVVFFVLFEVVAVAVVSVCGGGVGSGEWLVCVVVVVWWVVVGSGG